MSALGLAKLIIDANYHHMKSISFLAFLTLSFQPLGAQENPPPGAPPGDRFTGGGPPMGGVQQDLKIRKQFDKDGNGFLTADERKSAREYLAKEKAAGRGPRQGPGGGMRGGGGPGGALVPALMSGDANKDGKLSKDEISQLATTWYEKLDPDKLGKLDQDGFVSHLGEILPEGGGQGRRGGTRFLGPGLFAAMDSDKNASLSLDELKQSFERWHGEWDNEKTGLIGEEAIRAGLGKVLPAPNFGGRGRGPGGGGNRPPATPGPKLSSEEAKHYPDAALYDPSVLRTFFLEFENSDWEKELAEFHNTDVEVPAKLTVDGKIYPNVGVSFRGASSYFMVPEGHKRSLNITLDLADEDQRLLGVKTLNLLNSNGDPTFIRPVLFSHIARHYIPTPRANFVRMAINGESWGVYVSVEQFNADFMKDRFDSKKGERWKVPGSPRGRGGLEYIGDNIADYKKLYDLKSKDEAKPWEALIELCKLLHETPPEQLEAALKPILDVDGALKFLALDNALLNSDGYWTRASDYNIARDKSGRFHIIPHDMNESFHVEGGLGGPGGFGGPGGPGGPGGFGGPPREDRGEGARSERPANAGPTDGERPGRPGGNGGLKLDPLVALKDKDKPLYSKLLAVPALRERYLGYVRDIAENWLDWNKIGPKITEWKILLEGPVKADTKKLSSNETFLKELSEESAKNEGEPGRDSSLKQMLEQRRSFLFQYKPEE